MLAIVFIAIPFSFTEVEWIFPILTFLCRIDMIYLVVALIACIGSYKPKKKDPTKQKKKESNYYSYYLNDESKPIKEEEKNKKKFVFKTSKDRLYEEAVKYFGESAVRYRSKDSVIDDYLRVQEEMFEGKGRK